MKNLPFLTLFWLLIALPFSSATNIAFSLANAQIVNVSGNSWYQVDVYVSTTAAFKLGAGQVYFNYNTAAFGSNVQANAAILVQRPGGSILAQRHTDSNIPLYGPFVTNDNTNSRVSYAWIQSLSAGCYTSNNILTAPTWLFRIRLKYLPGQTGQPPEVCFEQGPVFLDLQFTACGPFSPPDDPDNPDAADCAGANAGQQIFEDAFDCTVNILPIELADFSGEWEGKNTRLSWSTLIEIDNDYFQLERSLDGLRFEAIAKVGGAGTSLEPQRYGWLDTEVEFLSGEHFYYRLRQVDFNGKESLSHIVGFTRDPTEGPLRETGLFSLLPNPSSGLFRLEYNGNAEALGVFVVRIYSNDGRLVAQFELQQSISNFDLTDVPAGNYWLSLSNENGSLQQMQLIIAR